jgi:hypothetical protein
MKSITILFILISTAAAGQSFKESYTYSNLGYSFAQALQAPVDSTARGWRSHTPGMELQKASRSFYFGIFAAGAGTTLALINPEDRTLRSVGIGLGVIGGAMLLKSFNHINRAGVLLDERKIGLTFNSGIGIKYSFR